MNPVRPFGTQTIIDEIEGYAQQLIVRSNGVNPVRPIWYYCYVLKSKKNGKLYTGTTTTLRSRLEQHNKRFVKSTRHMAPLRLIYSEICLNKDDAYRRERYLKSGMGKRYLRNRLKGGLTG